MFIRTHCGCLLAGVAAIAGLCVTWAFCVAAPESAATGSKGRFVDAPDIAPGAVDEPAGLAVMRRLLQAHEDGIDLETAKLTIDRLVDPTIDIVAVRGQLDALEYALRRGLHPDATRREKAEAILHFLHEPGPWNEHRPFRYDTKPAIGGQGPRKLLSHYLRTREGNCVSMPILYVILAHRIGLDVALATAPEHMLVKFRDDDGTWLNIEATSGGFKADAMYQQDLHITDAALRNRIYLRPLSRRESVARMMTILTEPGGPHVQATDRIQFASLALDVDPNDVAAMLKKASGYYLLNHLAYMTRYDTPEDIPADERPAYIRAASENIRLFAEAERLGWREWTPEQTAAYEAMLHRQHRRQEADIR